MIMEGLIPLQPPLVLNKREISCVSPCFDLHVYDLQHAWQHGDCCARLGITRRAFSTALQHSRGFVHLVNHLDRVAL